MSNLNSFVRIPKERVGVLIGTDGRIKSEIEKKLMVELEIESDGGEVSILLSKEAPDPTALFRAKDIVTAIGRGFSPAQAFRILRDEDVVFDLIDLRRIFGKSNSDIHRVKSRIIGIKGRTRATIEELTEADVVVYGHTIGLIGTFEQVDTARNAVQKIIQGSQHKTVYGYLQKKRHEMKKEKLNLWESPEDN